MSKVEIRSEVNSRKERLTSHSPEWLLPKKMGKYREDEENWNPCSLLMRMQNGAAAVE